jgi:exodeoxyribonuclease V beta subunit
LKPFDLLDAPLRGSNLIEASAGTGKTYNIEGLFIRLILEEQLPVDRILVLTFTKAATAELRDRIRNKLVRTKAAYEQGSSDDPLIKNLMKKFPDSKIAATRIHEALIDFDRAAIFTIHGFCQRLIHENAFETRNLFDTELIANQAQLIQEVVDDFWRKTLYSAPLELVSFALDRIGGPEYYYRLLDSIKIPEVRIIPEVTTEPSLNAIKPFRVSLGALKTVWPAIREAVIQILQDPALNAVIYGKLKPDEDHPEKTDRELKVIALAEKMDYFLHQHSIGFPLFDKFENFTSSKLAKATKKNHSPPDHEYFKLCDDLFTKGKTLESELERYLLFLKNKLFHFADTELKKRKKKKNIQYFDDLLITVRDALKSKNGNLLTDGIRQKFRAALVDEFQDTDSIQYDILAQLFSAEDTLLFMIGDPKQSIYSFRGADIFSYIKAARHSDTKFTLLENWRSHQNLITAVNAIFSSTKSPFVFNEIPFENGKPARQLSPDLNDSDAPFVLWYLDADRFSTKEKPIAKPTAVGLIANAVGGEIRRLISESSTFEPADIAVLVRTNEQAQIIKNTLTAQDVPSVLFSTGNIFDTREALEVETILCAIADPTNISLLKAALATDIIGMNAEGLISGDVETAWWETRLSQFREYYRLWDRRGFIHMFRLFLAEMQIKGRILGFLDGERRLTNILHLSEILHRQSTDKNLGVTALLKWLAQQRDPLSPRLEEYQLRLESDEKAVKIVTIHKSKGLEYNVVFCPFGWEASLIRNQEFTFHDIGDDFRLTFDLGSEFRSQNASLAQNELLSENLRLLYVALTRARQRCYLAWGRINTAETSALAYLLHGDSDHQGSFSPNDQTLRLKKSFVAKTNAELRDDLIKLADKSQSSIKIVPLPEASEKSISVMLKPEIEKPLICRNFAGNIDRSWRILSYSSLVTSGAPDADYPDRDASQLHIEQNSVISSEDREAAEEIDELTIFAFPRGIRAGSFFHDVLEHHDFSDKNSKHLENLVSKKLVQYGLDLRWHPTVCLAITKVLSVSLLPDHQQLHLSSIGTVDRINEMEFYYPLNFVSPRLLKEIFKDYSRIKIDEKIALQTENLSFAPSLGFMKGYIDMVFQHRGRFYLVDWKSNYLGPSIEHYDNGSLNKTMVAEHYNLQYHIYTLALHQHLRLQKSNYRYEKDFGGVFYIFIRGIEGTGDSRYGIFFDLPNQDLIDALGKTLIPGYN